MSRIKNDMVWQHQLVLPYILGGLKQKIEAITPVHKIMLFGSRGCTPVSQWQTLAGKDWDVLVVCNFPIINTDIWTKELGYHMDLVITNHKGLNAYLPHNKNLVELYPNYQLPPIQDM